MPIDPEIDYLLREVTEMIHAGEFWDLDDLEEFIDWSLRKLPPKPAGAGAGRHLGAG
jgi:hypothetical protein